jgi:hypothetical protein
MILPVISKHAYVSDVMRIDLIMSKGNKVIVCIESSYSFDLACLLEEEIAFLTSENCIKESYSGKKEFKYVGPIQNVPISMLNKRSGIDIEFFKNNPSGYVSNLASLGDSFSKTDFLEARKQECPIHIHIPSPELSYFNTVDFLEDSCTDKLQDWLGDGWRIIAVIPRPGQRRPDYILGRKE